MGEYGLRRVIVSFPSVASGFLHHQSRGSALLYGPYGPFLKRVHAPHGAHKDRSQHRWLGPVGIWRRLAPDRASAGLLEHHIPLDHRQPDLEILVEHHQVGILARHQTARAIVKAKTACRDQGSHGHGFRER